MTDIPPDIAQALHAARRQLHQARLMTNDTPDLKARLNRELYPALNHIENALGLPPGERWAVSRKARRAMMRELSDSGYRR